jgi:ABC-type nitrate/sulfonate/bicarbonate transport system permease component
VARPAALRRRVNWLGLATMVALAGVWEAVVRTGLLDYQFLPAPSAVAAAAGHLFSSGAMASNVLHTTRVTLVGWLLASAVGIGLGLVLGLSDRAWRWSMASIEILRAVPPVTLVPVTLLVFGFSRRMELTIVVFVSTWPVLVNTIDGVRSVAPELVDVARMLRLSTGDRIRRIVLPAAMRSIVVGLQLGLSLSLVLAVVAEMIGNPAGLGNALVRAQQALQPAQMFAYVFVVGLLGVGLNAIFTYLSTRLFPAPAPGR